MNFANEYKFLILTQHQELTGEFSRQYFKNPNSPENPYTIGTGLAALPAFAAADAIDWLHSKLTGLQRSSTFAPLYVFAFYTANVTYAALALALCYKFVRRYFGSRAAALGAWTAALAGPMLHYYFFDQAMSHLTGAFYSMAAVYCWDRVAVRGNSLSGLRTSLWAAVMGIAIGVATIVRPCNVPLAVLAAEPLLRTLIYQFHGRRSTFTGAADHPCTTSKALLIALISAAFTIIGAFPQLLAWHSQRGAWISNTFGYKFSILPPYFFNVLFSPVHGLFYWSPALLVGFIGVLFCLRGRAFPNIHRTAAVLLVIFLMIACMYGSWTIWWLGASFGYRGFIDSFFIFAFGIAAVVRKLARSAPKRSGNRIAAMIAALLITVNLHVMISWQCAAVLVDGSLNWLDTVRYGQRYRNRIGNIYDEFSDWRRGHRIFLFDQGAVAINGVPKHIYGPPTY